MAKVASPRNNTQFPADHLTVIAAGAVSNNDLTAISLRPNHAAQKLRVVNKNATTLQSLVFLGEDDAVNTTMSVPFNGQMLVDVPVKTLISAGADIEVHCYWWAGMNPNRNK